MSYRSTQSNDVKKSPIHYRSGKLLAAAMLVLSLFATGVEAGGGHALPAASQAHRQQVESQTMALARMAADYRSAGKAARTGLLNGLVDQARARQELLAEVVQNDPSGALRTVLPEKVRSGMPAEVLALLEQKQDLQGELEVSYEDYADGRHKLRHVLLTARGRFELKLPANAEQAGSMRSGMQVRARGWLFAHGGETSGSLVVNDSPDGLEVLADGATTTTATTSAAVLPNTMGQQDVLALLVNFQDNPVQPWTTAQAEQMVFGTVKDYYQENSNGQTWLTGDVYGYYSLPINSTCDSWEIHVKAQEAAAAQGVDASFYNRLVYIFPANSSCGWTGKGTIGGEPSRVWVNGSLSLRTVGHELGHNLGLYHAKELDCGSNIIGGTCVSFEYGDSMDIMGESGVTGQFNAFNKELLGWLTASAGEVVIADSDGSYQLEPYETMPAGGAKGLKILRGYDSLSGQPLWYYLEYRQALGFDSYLAGKPVTDGVVFRLATGTDGNTSELIDMTPESAWYDLDDSSLATGSTYTDTDAGVTVTTEWADATGASVNISYSGPTCIPANPALALSPAESAWVTAGTTVSYSATVTNQDSSGCAATDFSLSAQLPSGWIADSAILSLAPGESATVNINVTSDAAAADGFHDIPFTVINGSDTAFQNSATITYVVDTPAPVCVPANPTTSLSGDDTQAVPAGTQVSYGVTVTNQDSNGCDASLFSVAASAPAGWNATSGALSLAPGENGAILVGVTSAVDAAAGDYRIGIKIENMTDAGYSANYSVTYSVAAPVVVCESAAPLLSMSVNSSAEVDAGTTVQYSGTVTNQYSSDCENATFTLSAELPAGWSATSTNLSLAPGSSAPFTIEVTSASTAAAGNYSIVIHAANPADTGLSGNATVSYQIAPPLTNLEPVAVNDSVDMLDKTATVIDVLANDSDPDDDVLNVVQVTQGSQGNVQINADGTLTYTPAKNFKASDSFSYTISDGAKTATATVTVSLSSSTTIGGGKGGGKPNK